MKKWPWPLVFVIVGVLIAILIVFWRTTDPALQAQMLGWLDLIVPFIVGAGSGGAAGSILILRSKDAAGARRLAIDWSWPLAVIVIVVVIAIALMVGEAATDEIRDKLLGYFTSILPFVVGTGVGAVPGVIQALRRG